MLPKDLDTAWVDIRSADSTLSDRRIIGHFEPFECPARNIRQVRYDY